MCVPCPYKIPTVHQLELLSPQFSFSVEKHEKWGGLEMQQVTLVYRLPSQTFALPCKGHNTLQIAFCWVSLLQFTDHMDKALNIPNPQLGIPFHFYVDLHNTSSWH